MRPVLFFLFLFCFFRAQAIDFRIEKVTPASSREASDGAVKIYTEAGGMAPLRYKWSNGAETKNISGIAAGNYTVSIHDRFGIEYFLAVTVPVCPVYLDIEALQITSDNEFEKGQRDLDLSIDGGNPPFLVEWDTRERKEDIRVRANGEYCVRVHDAHCGDYHRCIQLNEPGLAASRESTAGGLTRVYPNPFWDELTIEPGETKTGMDFSAYLYDESGKAVLYQRYREGGGNVTFPIRESTADGSFYLRLIYENNTREVFPLIRLRELPELGE